MAIDYARMKVVHPKQKAALTRAKKKGFVAVLNACKAAVKEWDAIGAWPDDWSTWQRALDDATVQHNLQVVYGTRLDIQRLEDL